MRTRTIHSPKLYPALQRLADLVLGIVCVAGLGMALIFACLWL